MIFIVFKDLTMFHACSFLFKDVSIVASYALSLLRYLSLLPNLIFVKISIISRFSNIGYDFQIFAKAYFRDSSFIFLAFKEEE